MNLFKLLLICVLTFSLGCLVSCDAKASWFPSIGERASKITYTKDKRTNLCFAHNTVQDDHGFNWDVFTNVPCTPEVESLLVK